MNVDYYTILSLPAGASQEQIKKRYHQLALSHHPDKGNATDDEFILIQQAWETLRDPESRKQYDSQYARLQTLGGVQRVAAEVDLDDMEYDEQSETFKYPCRCGDMYSVSESELERSVELIYCSGCTLLIKILYQMEEDV